MRTYYDPYSPLQSWVKGGVGHSKKLPGARHWLNRQCGNTALATWLQQCCGRNHFPVKCYHSNQHIPGCNRELLDYNPPSMKLTRPRKFLKHTRFTRSLPQDYKNSNNRWEKMLSEYQSSFGNLSEAQDGMSQSASDMTQSRSPGSQASCSLPLALLFALPKSQTPEL